MIDLTQPAPLARLVDAVDAKTPLGSAMRTAEWEQMPQGIRDAAFFSAGVEDERWLQQAKDGIAEILDRSRGTNEKGEQYWKMDRARVVAELRRYGEALGLPRPGGRDGGVIRESDVIDPLSVARLKLIVNTQLAMAYGHANWVSAMEPAVLRAFPAWELVRQTAKRVPRDWRRRWSEAGGQFYEGRMIALKTDPIWLRLSRFGRPYPPFDFNSGMTVEDVRRRHALALGVMREDTKQEPNKESFAEGQRASVRGLPPEARERLTASLPGKVEIAGDEARLVQPGGTVVAQDGAMRTMTGMLPGATRQDARDIAAAPPGAAVTIRHDEEGRVEIEAKAEGFYATRRVRLDASGRTAIDNVSMAMPPTAQRQGVGTALLRRQVAAARRFGAAYLRLYAATNRRGLAGPQVWAKLGYDAPLPDAVAAAAEAIFGVRPATVQGLRALPGGPEWWEANAVSMEMFFDLSEDSTSLKVLSNYGKR